PLPVRKIPSPHTEIMTMRDEKQSRLSKHDLGGAGRPERSVCGWFTSAWVLPPGTVPRIPGLPSSTLPRELLSFGRRRLGPAVAPKEISFDQNLPKTRSGKVMRRLLRARELGLPTGDVSTLEGTA
ncbi:AMP-binding enzyme, partial [Streptomyces rochei]